MNQVLTLCLLKLEQEIACLNELNEIIIGIIGMIEIEKYKVKYSLKHSILFILNQLNRNKKPDNITKSLQLSPN